MATWFLILYTVDLIFLFTEYRWLINLLWTICFFWHKEKFKLYVFHKYWIQNYVISCVGIAYIAYKQFAAMFIVISKTNVEQMFVIYSFNKNIPQILVENGTLVYTTLSYYFFFFFTIRYIYTCNETKCLCDSRFVSRPSGCWREVLGNVVYRPGSFPVCLYSTSIICFTASLEFRRPGAAFSRLLSAHKVCAPHVSNIS